MESSLPQPDNPACREDPSSLVIRNSTISGNYMEGLSVYGSSYATVINSTITKNTASPYIPPQYHAGGVNSNNGNVTLINTIVADNAGGDINGIFNAASRHNLIGDSSEANLVNGVNGNIVGTAANPVDAMLAPLGYYGGLTPTHALLPGSLAIDAGDNSAVSGLIYDQRGPGFPRIIDGGHGLLVDIGAYEYNPSAGGQASGMTLLASLEQKNAISQEPVSALLVDQLDLLDLLDLKSGTRKKRK